MKLFLLVLVAFSTSLLADQSLTIGNLKIEASGNIEAQARHTWNSSLAQKSPLFQRWKESNFSVFTGNLNLKASFKDSRIDSNIFLRQAYSPLYQENYVAPRIMNFPNQLIARDVFRLNYSRQDSDHQTDAVINKLAYEIDGENSRFVIGRMFVNYGVGEIFNPINPFNQPLGLVGSLNVAQGNDGFKSSFFLSDRSTLSFFLMGDKQLNGEQDRITRTIWLHWDYRLTDKWQFEVVAGEDQKRNKAGLQANYTLDNAIVFMQALYSSEFTDGNDSENLWDLMLGYDNQLTTNWHIRFESGHQETDGELITGNTTQLNGRYLPYEYFAALANSYDIHPLVELSATLIHDIKTNYGYGLGRVSWSVVKDCEWDFFVFSPIYHTKDSNAIQKLITTDVGTALRYFF